MLKGFFKNFKSKNFIQVIPEQKAKLLISKTIVNFSIAVLLLVITTGFFGVYNPLQSLIRQNASYFYSLSTFTSFIALATFFVSSYKHLGRVSVKFLRNCYWTMVISATVSTSLWISVLGSLGIIDLSFAKFAFIFAAPSAIFLLVGLIVRNSNWDFTKLKPVIMVTSLFVFVFALVTLLFGARPREGVLNFIMVVLLLLHIGIVSWEMSVMKKHAQFLKAMNDEADFIIGEESMKFVYSYSMNLFWSFVRIVEIIVQLMIRNR